MNERSLATVLGWFSVGLGLVELLGSRRIGEFFGVGHPGLVRLCGVRELATGIGLLTHPRKGAWLWARVVGDAVDLALIGAAFRAQSARPTRLAFAAGSVGAISVLDAIGGRRLSRWN